MDQERDLVEVAAPEREGAHTDGEIQGVGIGAAPAPDYFVERDGVHFAGTHILIDMWGAAHLTDIEVIRDALIRAVEACSATLLHIHLHHFGESGGVSGVAVLAESHISIHTWPERGFAAIDIFMCGACDPARALPILREVFHPEAFNVSETRRGLVE
ncbi:MAG: adenosylmethionine decarboxylase [Alphaproteobacteria bacterium]|nr:adenosylmethionine decarboxylase [Alphaproteobacteria bacterium]